MLHLIEITESRRRIIEVEAASVSDAIAKTAKEYAKGNIVLSFHDDGEYKIKQYEGCKNG